MTWLAQKQIFNFNDQMLRILLIFAITAGLLIFVFSAAEDYADRSAIPRYCADPSGVIDRVGEILTRTEPIGEGTKRPFVVAAKLIFLVPQQEGETVDRYLDRLRQHIGDVCLTH